MFNGNQISLIWDKHTSHYSDEVLQFITMCNEQTTTSMKIILELVDEGLTPIILVSDVAVNKIFKFGVKKMILSISITFACNCWKKDNCITRNASGLCKRYYPRDQPAKL